MQLSVLKCVETDYLQVRLTRMVCPERMYKMFTSSQTLVHSDSAFKKQEQHFIFP